MTAGPRRRTRPHVSPIRALVVVLVVLFAVAAAFVVWTVLPLTDRSAGEIPPGMAVTGGGVTQGAGGLAPLSAAHASGRPIAGVHVASGVIVDATTGAVFWAVRPHQRRPVASLTKLMTALVALQHKAVTGTFHVTPAMTHVAGYTIGIRAGQSVRARDMLAGALIASGNDAANALAVHAAGSIHAFVRDMNKEAGALGLKATRYSNPSGIVDAGNHSSAWDVAQLSRIVLKHNRIASLVQTKAYTPARGADYVNRNQLLWDYTGAIGLKTGFTTGSGPSIDAAATRNGHTLIAVALDLTGNEFDTAARMLDWGFARAAHES
jgi:serine-type D-Ala-D-Ala carboxypeptidase (penicillin-binding protein 5/6)